MSSKRWTEISPSSFPWEREALEFVRERLPDHDPYRAWSNFEFVADDGSINEVDLLVLTREGFFLVEIKSRPGVISGDVMTWVWNRDGKVFTDDNPLLLANRKAKKLASLLRKQSASRNVQLPYLDALVFSSHPESESRLQGVAGYRVCLRDTAERGGIMAALLRREYEGANEQTRAFVNRPIAKAIGNALEQAGVRKSQRSRRASDYVLGELLYESPTGLYQDWAATHVSVSSAQRRVRIYNIARNTSEEARETIGRAAKREFQLLDSMSHRGILPVEGFTEHELGPALVFRHDPRAVRLDHYLTQYADCLSVDMRLSLLRQIAEAVKYAHEKRVVHRSLSPQSILVSDPETDSPRVRIFNWQAGYRGDGSVTNGARLTATVHPEQLVEDASTVYMAPEALNDPESLGEHLDLFSLGAIAYHIFSGQPPASSGLELTQKVRDGKGLQISSVMDGAGKELQELIQFSTHPAVLNRMDSAADFLAWLNVVEDELTTPDAERELVDNPLEAGVGDRLPGGFEVRARLGSGSSAVAMLVVRDGRELVLKLANQPEHNERLKAEAEVLKKLRHQNIVEAYDTVNVGPLVGFTMQPATDKLKDGEQVKAGAGTLANRLRVEGRLHLELLERFGSDLLDAVRFLEESGIPHRDIKPENIGIRALGRGDKLRLLLFDFSLSRTPADNIRAGTRPYLDPFLSLRQPPRWDLAAERFAAAVTLHEMATGTLPRWGDGQSSPEVLDCEATINPEFFDPDLREAMVEFFSKALRRDYRRRFDNAEEMLRAWRLIFEAAGEPTSGTTTDDGLDYAAVVEDATLATQMVTLGLSTRAVNALDSLNVINVRDLLNVPLRRVYRLRGVGSKTRREMAGLYNALRRKFPEAAQPARPSATGVTDTEGAEPEVASVDLLARQVANFGPRGGGAQAERGILQTFVGWDKVGREVVFDWPSQTEVARRFNLTRARVGQVVTKARERWRKNASVTALRETLAELLEANGGAMTVDELCTAVLAARGSGEEEPARSQLASVVVRAALEAERGSAEPRFAERRAGRSVLVTTDPSLADYAERLGRIADELAALDPMPTPARALEALREAAPIEGAQTLTDARLFRLAVAASEGAAVSSRMEIYPRGMAAVRALKLAHGALFGARELTVEDARGRVAGRYPDAEPLPDRPALDQLFNEVGLDLVWDAAAADGRGAYRYRPGKTGSELSGSTSHYRRPTELTPAVVAEVSPAVAEARVFENKIRRAHDEGAFLALVTSPQRLEYAERELLQRFELERVNFDEVFIRVMREQARALGADWNVVLRADASRPDGADWRRLQILVGKSLPFVEEELSRSEKTLLLMYPGLLARYDRLDLLERLRDKVGRAGSTLHGLWVLLPGDGQSALPVLNGKSVPVISAGQWARIPDAWIENRHRSENGSHP
ncbi:MAG TPA: BREX system serine/threonine kinase PglW [Pyrinomonadaceae bacterium]